MTTETIPSTEQQLREVFSRDKFYPEDIINCLEYDMYQMKPHIDFFYDFQNSDIEFYRRAGAIDYIKEKHEDEISIERPACGDDDAFTDWDDKGIERILEDDFEKIKSPFGGDVYVFGNYPLTTRNEITKNNFQLS